MDVGGGDAAGESVDRDLVLEPLLGERERSGSESDCARPGVFLGPVQVCRQMGSSGDVDLTADLSARIGRRVHVDVVVPGEKFGDLAGGEVFPGSVGGGAGTYEVVDDVVDDAAVDAALAGMDVRSGNGTAQSFHGNEEMKIVPGQREHGGAFGRGRDRRSLLIAGQVGNQMRLGERRGAGEKQTEQHC